MTYFIFGAGYSVRHFTRQLSAPAFGTTRQLNKFEMLQQANIKPVLFTDSLNDDMRAILRETTHLICSIAPQSQGDVALSALRDVDLPNLQWIGYLSTIGVYGDHQGQWIDEQTKPNPSLQRNVWRVQVEQDWQDFADKHDVPLSILRLAGIYGPGRNVFIKLQNNKAQRIIKPGQVFNRIHVDDIAGVLYHLSHNNLEGIFNVSDDLPSPPQDVITFAAQLMGHVPSAEIAFEDATMTPMARTFYGDNKRVLNTKLKQTGYQLKYSNYKQALTQMWENDLWQ